MASAHYGKDLAYIHDTGHGAFARKSAPGLKRMLSRAKLSGGLVVDMGCGSGIWARELTDAGYDVFGVDISSHMIRIARKQAPRARFRVGSFLDAAIPPCAAVTSVGECLGYLFDESNGRGALQKLFRRVHEALQPGGLFIFDLLQPGVLGGKREQERCIEGSDWVILLRVEESAAKSELTRRITSFRKQGRHYTRDDEIHRLRLHRSADVARDLRRRDFAVRVVRGYGNLRFRGTQVGFVARKR